MKIKDIMKLPEDAVCKYDENIHKIHINPKNGYTIHSLYNVNRKNLIERLIIDKSGNGFGIYLGADNELLWLYLIKNNRTLFKYGIVIGYSKSDK